MIQVSSAFKRALANDKRDYLLKCNFTLADGETTFLVENDRLWEGGVKIDDAVSNQDVFEIGAAIINQCTIVLNNIDGYFDEYDFYGAKVVVSVGLSDLDDDSTEYIQKGVFFVDDPDYNGSVITLTCLDAMSKFDKAYTTNMTFPKTMQEIVQDACTTCGVILDTATIPRGQFTVPDPPSGQSCTFRQVISWAAQIAGCFARINRLGHLELKFYDFDTLEAAEDDLDGGLFDPWNTADVADGGGFNPWNTGDAVNAGGFPDFPAIDIISSSYSHRISTDDVVITGVRIVQKDESEDSGTGYINYNAGTDGYLIVIEGNELIQGTRASDVVTWLGNQLIGLKFRKASINHPSDPSIEAGDVGFYFDRKGNRYSIIISSTSFDSFGSQSTDSSAETPRKSSAQRFSQATSNYVDMRKQMDRQRTAFELALEDLAERVDNAGGLYSTEVPQPGGGSLIYYHNKPNLNESDIRMLFSDVGFTLTDSGGQTWYGMTVDGTMIASIMNTIGINFDWGVGGSLVIKDLNQNETFYANASTGVVRIKATQFSLDGASIADIADGEIDKLQIGGRNLLVNTGGSDATKVYGVGDTANYITGFTASMSDGVIHLTQAATTDGKSFRFLATSPVSMHGLSAGQTYNISFYLKGQTANYITVHSLYYVSGEWVSGVDKAVFRSADSPLNTYKLISVSDTIPSNATGYCLGIWSLDNTAGTNIYIKDVMLENGNKATAWVPAPEDTTQEIDAAIEAQTQLDIFNKLTNNGQTQGIYLENSKVYINASYIKAGTFSVSKTIGNDTVDTFYANADTGYVAIRADYLAITSGGTVQSVQTVASNAAASAVDGQTQSDIYNKLTNNSQNEGIYLSGGHLYINASMINTGTLSANYIQGGTLTLGGSNNANGQLIIQNSSGNTIGTWNNSGISMTSGGVAGWEINATQIINYSQEDYNHVKYRVSLNGGSAITDPTNAAFVVEKIVNNSHDSYPVVIRYDGKLIGTNAEITGEVKADTGRIGGSNGWTISSQKITSGTLGNSSSFHMGTTDLGSATIAGNSRSDWRLAIGQNFGVTNTGALYANSANLTGTITSNGSASSYSYSTTVGSGFTRFYGTNGYLNGQIGASRLSVGGSVDYGMCVCGVGDYLLLNYASSEPGYNQGSLNGIYLHAGSRHTGVDAIELLGDVSIAYDLEVNGEVVVKYDDCNIYSTLNTIGGYDSHVLHVNSPYFAIGTGTPVNGYRVYVSLGDAYFEGSISCYTLTQRSDENNKVISPWDYRLDNIIDDLEPIYFKWKSSDKDDKTHIGFGARKTREVFQKHGFDDAGIFREDDGVCSLAYSEVIPLLVGKVQKQQKTIEEQQSKIDSLEERLSKLEALLQAQSFIHH